MKLKTLKKKIRRLETRLLEGPKKLAKLKGKLAALVKANAAKAKKKSMARAAAASKKKRSSTAKFQAKPASAKAPAPKKEKRKLNLSPERREQLAAAMRARWAAKRAAEVAPPRHCGHWRFHNWRSPSAPCRANGQSLKFRLKALGPRFWSAVGSAAPHRFSC